MLRGQLKSPLLKSGGGTGRILIGSGPAHAEATDDRTIRRECESAGGDREAERQLIVDIDSSPG